MFFDDVEEIAVAFQPLLLEIALIQKKMYIAVHLGTDQENLSRLNRRREQLQQQLRVMNQTEQGSRYYWWDQQWDVMVNRLQEDTGLKGDCGEDADGWEWEELLREEKNDGLHQLVLLEQARKAGHVVLRDSWVSGTRSRYSAEDEQTMIEQHNKRIFDNEVWNPYLDSGPVRSAMSEKDYDSLRDYYNSDEHMMYRNMEENVFQSMLYEDFVTHTQKIASSNLHYGRISMIAVFHIAKDGMLDLIQPYGFQTKAEYGNLPENNYSRYQNCKSEVFCAEYIAAHHLARSVPASLISHTADGSCESPEEALAEAEMFTCLGNLLKV